MSKIILNEKEYIENVLNSYDGEKYNLSLVDVSQSQLIYLLAKYVYQNENWSEWESLDGNIYKTPKIWKEEKLVDTETGEIFIDKKCKSNILSTDALYLANKVDNMLLLFNYPDYESFKMLRQIKKACSTVIKYDLRLKENCSGVPLLSDELENIKNCDTDREKKLLFACYIYARYKNKNGRIDDDIVKKQLFDMANVKGSKLELNMVIKSLREKGYISQSFVNSNITIWVNMGSGEEIFSVTDFNTLGNQIMVYLKENYKMCECCHRLIKFTSNSQKFCEKCASEQEYYEPVGVKTIKCIDCGKDVEVVAWDMKTCRCEECGKEYLKYYDRRRKYIKNFNNRYANNENVQKGLLQIYSSYEKEDDNPYVLGIFNNITESEIADIFEFLKYNYNIRSNIDNRIKILDKQEDHYAILLYKQNSV